MAVGACGDGLDPGGVGELVDGFCGKGEGNSA